MTMKSYNIEVKESRHQIALPYGNIGIRYLWWTPEAAGIDWTETEKAFDEIVDLADQVNASVSFVLVPSPASVYGMSLYPDFSIYFENQKNIVHDFRRKYRNFDVIDPTEQLAKEIQNEFLYIGETDCHFNTHGTRFTLKL